MLKEGLFGIGAIAFVAGGIYMNGDAYGENVYRMDIKQAHSKLMNTKIPQFGNSPFSDEAVISAPTPTSVRWAARLDLVFCDATLEKLEKNQVRVNHKCTFPDNFLAAHEGSVADILDIGLKEHIASTLTGRPFDKQKITNAVIGYSVVNHDKIAKDTANHGAEVQKSIDDGSFQEKVEEIEQKYEEKEASREQVHADW
jgi:hypothetical protein